jgi:hypothetical protein
MKTPDLPQPATGSPLNVMLHVRAQMKDALVLADEFSARMSPTNFKLAMAFIYISTGMSIICDRLEAMKDDDIERYEPNFDFLIPSMKAILNGDRDADMTAVKSGIDEMIDVLML